MTGLPFPTGWTVPPTWPRLNTHPSGVSPGAAPVRLIVRRVKPTPGTQLALFASYSYHAFITGRDGDTLGLEADHRRHAEVENAIRDLKYGVGLNHLPSGRFAANAAWLAVQVMAHNLVWYVGMRQTDPTWVEENRGPAWSSHPTLIEPEQLPGPIEPASCKEGPTLMQEVQMEGEPRFVGIDVSKAGVDVAVRPTGRRWVMSYDEAGSKELVSQMVDLGPALVLLEATGGLELPLVAALAAAALPVVVVNPRQVRDFARATGTLAKTDALDAAVLAHFADAVRPSVRPPQGRRDPGPQLADCPPAPGDDHAGIREEPTGYCHQSCASSRRSPHRLVGPGVARLGPGVTAVSSPKSSMAREGRPAAHRSRRRGATLSHPAGRPARVGRSGPTADRGLGGRGALQPGQRYLARPTRRLGRTLPGSGCSLYGNADRDPFQSHHQRLLPEAAGGW